MNLPLQISFRNIGPSPAIEARVREKAEKLESYFDRIMGCRVMIEAQERRHHKGKLYHVRLDITVPGAEIVVSRNPKEKHAHEDVYVAIRDAFNAARRQLEDHSRVRGGKVKVHEVPLHGKVRHLSSYEGFGVIETRDGNEIYFHRNSVLNGGFDKLEIGAEVRFDMAESESEKGPQATSVRLIGKHHIVE
jgi:ribosomal subunit interface protein